MVSSHLLGMHIQVNIYLETCAIRLMKQQQPETLFASCASGWRNESQWLQIAVKGVNFWLTAMAKLRLVSISKNGDQQN